jgi:biofilm protein TabA
MLHADINEPGSYQPLLAHPTWNKALEWLQAMPPEIRPGIYEILGRDMFVSVQEYDTVYRAAARFESHRQHVDLQYTILGEEGIDWCPRNLLEPDGGFENDVQFWLPPTKPYSTIVNSPGRFSVFFPADAHRPKVRLSSFVVRKLVIKVNIGLLS